jgi:hypothetical protein
MASHYLGHPTLFFQFDMLCPRKTQWDNKVNEMSQSLLWKKHMKLDYLRKLENKHSNRIDWKQWKTIPII